MVTNHLKIVSDKYFLFAGTPLLSRFDLILILVDDHLETWDSLVAGHLLECCNELDEDYIGNYKC